MTDKPILFSAPMVRALLEGRKSQTRRILKIKGHKTFVEFGSSDTPEYDWHFRDAEMRWHDLIDCELKERLRHVIGDRLWVRESWSGEYAFQDIPPSKRTPLDTGHGTVAFPESVHYWADGDPEFGDWERGRPSIHMPRWASRLTLQVTDVRIQRLREISREDARAEGIEPTICSLVPDGHVPTWRNYVTGEDDMLCEIDSFGTLWDSLNAKKGTCWHANPWIVAYTFTTHHCNIDQMEADQ